ncbi:thiosulfate oxidation carrier protein SoxY [Hyphomicrobium sp.]|uniref:thiosulfate oxidation carrier protein SoxY n=1 Tax=Hyphomicrobium sp. TaxID=82 RepID=UPI002E37DAD6|nr:thiosulfate oxidation carrier protein SoxY [Hyphomicrobium sp.]HEX2843168.1 thiosulfate oxidation carrier protein SoxY [Hyphomicrobium sp.]
MTSRGPLFRRLVDRRTILASFGFAGAAATGLLAKHEARAETALDKAAPASAAAPASHAPTAQFEEIFGKIVGNGTPIEGRMVLELPEDAENGSIVPYKISIESPMTEEDHIARVHLLSTQNPQASVATFHFTPLSGKAAVSGRMRLAKTQDVVAVALTSSNSLLIARTKVSVGIGGCGTE